jgi:enediyne biosynthesis protein E4
MEKIISNANRHPQPDAGLKPASGFATSFLALFIILIFSNCNKKPTLFERLSSSKTGIKFKNTIVENDKFNVLDYMNIYTGAGVAVGDINNDGLMDVYFSGNQTTGRLYVNKGNLQFEDVTEKAGLVSDRWQTGVSMVDINQDGFVDIYVNVSGSEKFGNLANLLYINNQNGTFSEKAEEYGIAEKRLTMNSSFFDYDKDGDLDLFLITNPADEMVSGVNTVKERKINGESDGTDILYRNDSPPTPKGGASGTTPPSGVGGLHFTDVSREAGILTEGYSLGAAISDFNQDGFPDIFVSNDFLSNDILYINNGNGTFTDRINDYLKHTSFASMGNDAADINNDGLTDLFVLDMLPEDNFRRKMIIPPTGYDKFQLLLEKGYTPSYTRNTLQLNNGTPPTPEGGDARRPPPSGIGGFSEISFLSGVSATDWSWAALFADYDNDGDKDLMVTNGFYRDLGNLDYITYQSRLQNPMGRQDAKRAEKLKAIHTLENVPIQNYLYENNGDLTFAKRSDDWGFTEKGFSNGAVYADLDNDGDLELIINDFNSEAKVYENKSNTLLQNHFLKVKLQGNAPNLEGFGSKISVYSAPEGSPDKDGKGGKMQFQELQPSRGYESSVSPILNFGLGKTTKIDSIVVVWANGNRQVETNISIDKQLIIKYLKTERQQLSKSYKLLESLFTPTANLNIEFKHVENNYNDFKIQPLLPQLHSQGSPAIATGDVNGDGLEDFYISAAAGSAGCFFIQTARPDASGKGKFNKKPMPQVAQADETGALLFDADGDKDLDLYIVGGGSEFENNTPPYQDHLLVNDGTGNFTLSPNALPDTRASGSLAISCDYDHDGDLDLFVGGRVSAGAYPMPPRSYLLRNDSPRDGASNHRTLMPNVPIFTDVTPPYLQQIGMVTAANWTDIDNDGWADLALVGEFMPLTFIKNVNGTIDNKQSTINNTEGWWSSLASADFDGDGDMDFIAGNIGLNTRYKASDKEPLCVYAKDFDKNGRIDPILCYYSQGVNYMARTRDELIKQIAAMRGRFESYKDFANATFDKSFTKEELKDAYLLKATCFESCYFENKGGGNFEKHPLSINAQFAPINGILIQDFDKDGHLDALIAGNSYGTEPTMGRYDASTGSLLKGDGKGNFTVLKSRETGFVADKDVKSLAKIKLKDKSELILIGNNSAQLGVFRFQNKEKTKIVN